VVRSPVVARVASCVSRCCGPSIRPLSHEDGPDPTPAGDEVVVRVGGARVCHTDVHIQEGLLDVPLPLVLGHEIAGVAEGHGPVLVFESWGDGTRAFCARGDDPLRRAAAEPGLARHGGYAEAVIVPSARFLVPLAGLVPVRPAPLADAGVRSVFFDEFVGRDELDASVVHLITSSLKPVTRRPTIQGNVT
jgi:D-arabinose 1-dehydrogenase-like Zn-dependent alcohol dehydrogenase